MSKQIINLNQNLMKNFSYVFAILFLVFNCSSDDNNDTNNIDPGPFSVTILETRMDGANIEWTEAQINY